jgi:hypothetical protein
MAKLQNRPAGHLHVQEHQIRSQSLDFSHGFETILSLTAYLDALIVFHEPTQPHSGVRLVIDDQRAQFVHAVVAIGIKIWARVPRRGSLSKKKRASPW